MTSHEPAPYRLFCFHHFSKKALNLPPLLANGTFASQGPADHWYIPMTRVLQDSLPNPTSSQGPLRLVQPYDNFRESVDLVSAHVFARVQFFYVIDIH